ncbi:MAG: NFACT family protein, partial [Lachnospiraceae bacterium]
MALDGLTIANIVYELNEKLLNSRLYKIAQPEPDELMLTIKSYDGQYRLTVSANASLPLIYLTDTNKVSPLTAPNFCMLLRKHLNNGRIISITQPGLERIIIFEIEHLNELGDLCRKKLIIELMGKHSNIIFTDDKDMILDSIKHISAQVSSVREVLPGRTYFIPNTREKLNPLELTFEAFSNAITGKPIQLKKALYSVLTGFSPVIALELCNI